jgi:hypothetical protein
MGDFANARSMFTRAIRAEPRRFVHYGRLALALVPPAGARVWSRPEVEAHEQKLATN